MRVLRAADHRVMPWKNGGGVTTEIAVHPEGAGLDDFEWRLSMARVESDGPFSLFPGVDRTLAVLDGEGIVLSLEGLSDERLTLGAPPFAFAADIAVSARLVAGPITDLNVMTRRGRWTHRVVRLSHSQTRTTFGAAATTIVLCASGSGKISSNGAHAALAGQDAAIIEAAPCEVTSSEEAQLYVIMLDRLAA